MSQMQGGMGLDQAMLQDPRFMEILQVLMGQVLQNWNYTGKPKESFLGLKGSAIYALKRPFSVCSKHPLWTTCKVPIL